MLAVDRPVVVDLRWQLSATRISVLSCAGLANRAPSTPVFTILRRGPKGEDLTWLEDLANITNPPLTPASEFIDSCIDSVANNRIILYNHSSQRRLIPNVLTMAGVLQAVPVEQGAHARGATVVFDATSVWAGYSALDATSWVYDRYANATTTMAMMNPGLKVKGHPWDPPLTWPPSWGLADYVVKERLFAFFLPVGCIPLTAAHALMRRMVDGPNAWPKPIEVWGYNNAVQLAGGDTFEAETSCVRHPPPCLDSKQG